MALSTQPELVASVQAWLAETSAEVGLAARVPDLIALLESDLNNDCDFRLLEMQKAQKTTPNEGDSKIALPDDYLEMDYLTVTTAANRPPLTYVSPRDLATKNEDRGYVQFYSIIGQEIWVYPAFGDSETLEMGFYVKIPALTAVNTTNWLLTKAPDVYLYGTLLQAEPYLENDDRMATWNALYEKARQKLIDANEKAVSSAGPLVVGLPVTRVA